MAKEFLSNENVKFDYIDVTQDGDALEEMVNLSGSRSVPVISGCGEVIVGFDKGRLTKMVECVREGQ